MLQRSPQTRIWVCTLTVTAIAITKAIIPTIINTIPLPLAKSGPTEDILRQCGHRAKALFNVLNCRRQHFDREMKINKTITLIHQYASLLTHQKCVMAMGTAYPTHAWHG